MLPLSEDFPCLSDTHHISLPWLLPFSILLYTGNSIFAFSSSLYLLLAQTVPLYLKKKYSNAEQNSSTAFECLNWSRTLGNLPILTPFSYLLYFVVVPFPFLLLICCSSMCHNLPQARLNCEQSPRWLWAIRLEEWIPPGWWLDCVKVFVKERR